jgi:PTH1 family peptidyl-tRNA hydrolase
VRIGVGRPPGRQDPADFVLEPFAKREVDEARSLVETAADAVTAVIASGVEAAQDRFNRSGPRD